MLYFVCHFYFTPSLQEGCWYLLISFTDKNTLNSDFMHSFTVLVFLTKQLYTLKQLQKSSSKSEILSVVVPFICDSDEELV